MSCWHLRVRLRVIFAKGESLALDTIVLKPTLDPEKTEWLSNLQRQLVH
jgi:hypothetical protein